MIVSCPACPKTYDVPSDALPAGGREVACSACSAVWIEYGQMGYALAAGAAGADVAMPGADVFNDVIEAEFEAVEERTPRLVTDRAVQGSVPSPARAQQTALTVAYMTPDLSPDELDDAAAREAVRLLLVAVRKKVRRAGDQFLAIAGYGLGTVLHAIAALRGRPAPPRSTTPGELLARQTRARMRARAANALTPARTVGWAIWASTVGAVVFALTTQGPLVRSAFPPAAKLYALGTAAPLADLRVTGSLKAYAMSSQGPAVILAGSVENDGADAMFPVVTMTAITPDGPVAQDLSLPPVALPPGGERPFAVRALIPQGANALRLTVAPGEPSRDGFTLQSRGGAWGSVQNGHAGPPSTRDAPGPRKR